MYKPAFKNFTLGIAAAILIIPGTFIGIAFGEVFSFIQTLLVGNADGFLAYTAPALGGLCCGLWISMFFKRWIDCDFPKTFLLTASALPFVSLLAIVILPFISSNDFLVAPFFNGISTIVGLFYGLREAALTPRVA